MRALIQVALLASLVGSLAAPAVTPEEEALLRVCSGRRITADQRADLADFLTAYLAGAHEGKLDDERMWVPRSLIEHFARRYGNPAHERAYVGALTGLFRANRLTIEGFGLIYFTPPESNSAYAFWSDVFLPLSRRSAATLSGLSLLFRLENALTEGHFLWEAFPEDMYGWIYHYVEEHYPQTLSMNPEAVRALVAQLRPAAAPAPAVAAGPQTGEVARLLAGARTSDFALRAVFDAELREKLPATITYIAQALGDDRAKMRALIEAAIATRTADRAEAAPFLAKWSMLTRPLDTTAPVEFWWSLFGWAGKQGRGTVVALLKHLPNPDGAPAGVATEVRAFLAERGE